MKFSASLLLSVLAASASSKHVDGGVDCRRESDRGILKCSPDYNHVTMCERGTIHPFRLEWRPFLNCEAIGHINGVPWKCDWISHKCVEYPTQDNPIYNPNLGN